MLFQFIGITLKKENINTVIDYQMRLRTSASVTVTVQANNLSHSMRIANVG